MGSIAGLACLVVKLYASRIIKADNRKRVQEFSLFAYTMAISYPKNIDEFNKLITENNKDVQYFGSTPMIMNALLTRPLLTLRPLGAVS